MPEFLLPCRRTNSLLVRTNIEALGNFRIPTHAQKNSFGVHHTPSDRTGPAQQHVDEEGLAISVAQ